MLVRIIDLFNKEMKQFAKTENCDFIITTGDINFDNRIWKTPIFNVDYEKTVLESLGKYHFKEVLSQKQENQLDVFLINNPSNVINRSELNEFSRPIRSCHKACEKILQLTHETFLDVKDKHLLSINLEQAKRNHS